MPMAELSATMAISMVFLAERTRKEVYKFSLCMFFLIPLISKEIINPQIHWNFGSYQDIKCSNLPFCI